MLKQTGWMIATVTLLGVTACSNKASDKQGDTPASTVQAGASSASSLVSSWADVSKMPDFFTGNWMSVSSMVDGPVKVEYTDKAKQYIAKYKPKADIALANATCKLPGMPIVQRASSPIKFLYEPGMIAIYMEHASQTRFIFLNQPAVSSNPTYLGNSTAHFEGDTLVVDSNGFADDIVFQYGATASTTPGFAPGSDPAPGPGAASGSSSSGEHTFLSNAIFGPHGPNMRMVERMRLTDPNTLEIKTTIYDDSVFTTPYEAETRYWKRQTGNDGKPQEWVCTVAISRYDEKLDKHIDLTPEEALKLLEQQQAATSGL